jgi:ParB/RepB/Spo0J family partition protein
MAGFKERMASKSPPKKDRPDLKITDLMEEGDASEFIQSAKDRGVYLELSADHFVADERQPRKTFTEEGLAELRESIEQNGQLQPILVKPRADGKYPIIAGERRWRAIKGSSKVLKVKAVISSGSSDELHIVLMQLDENNKRESVPVMETVEAMARVVALCKAQGKKQGDAAKLLGMSAGRLSKYLSLMEVPEEVKALSVNGKTQDLDTLYELGKASKRDQAGVQALLASVEEGGLPGNLRQAAAAVGKSKPKTDGEDEAPNKQRPSQKPKASRVCHLELENGEDGDHLILVFDDESKKRLALDASAVALLRDGLSDK